MSLLGYGQDLNRDVLDEQKQQYDLAKEKTAEWVTEQIVAQLIETQWLLKGIWPAALTWSAEWMGKDPMNAVSLAELGKALATLRTTGLLTDETLLRMFSRFVPGFDMEAELKALQGQMADEMARVAASASARAVCARGRRARAARRPVGRCIGFPFREVALGSGQRPKRSGGYGADHSGSSQVGSVPSGRPPAL